MFPGLVRRKLFVLIIKDKLNHSLLQHTLSRTNLLYYSYKVYGSFYFFTVIYVSYVKIKEKLNVFIHRTIRAVKYKDVYNI